MRGTDACSEPGFVVSDNDGFRGRRASDKDVETLYCNARGAGIAFEVAENSGDGAKGACTGGCGTGNFPFLFVLGHLFLLVDDFVPGFRSDGFPRP